jgi:HK97 family phage major capsid protein
MNIALLERELAAKQSAAKDLFSKHTKAADAAGREMTDDERGEVQKALDDANGIKGQIARAKSDDAMRAEVDRIIGVQEKHAQAVADQTREAAKGRKSMGQQFVESAAMDFLKTRRHHGSGMWQTPSVELHATTITSDDGSPGSGGDLIVPQYLPGVKVPLLFRRLVVADLLAPGTTDSNAIIYMQETVFTNAADTVAEGAIKPESTLIFDKVTETIHKIAHWIPITDEMLEDVSYIRSYVDGRLRLGVMMAEEDKLLNGAASPDEINGLLNRTGLRTAEVAGGSPDSPNADAVFRQMMGIFTDSFIMPDGIVMNPSNWQTIQLMKDTSGAYMGGGPFGLPPAPRLWGLPVVVTPAITTGTALVGAFGSQAQIFRKGGIQVAVSNSHSDFFIRNLTAIRAEERLGLAVYRPSAFGTVTGLD